MQFWGAPCAKKPSDSSGWMGRWAATLLIDPFGAAIQGRPRLPEVTCALPGFRREVLHDLELDLLNFREPFPLSRQDVIDLFVQMTDLELGLQVHAIVVLRPQAILRLLPLLAHHDDGCLDCGQTR